MQISVHRDEPKRVSNSIPSPQVADQTVYNKREWGRLDMDISCLDIPWLHWKSQILSPGTELWSGDSQ